MEGYSSGDGLANELSGLIPQITMPKITFKKAILKNINIYNIIMGDNLLIRPLVALQAL